MRPFHEPARVMSADELPWPVRLALILLGYSSVAAPAALLVYYVKKRYAGASAHDPTTCIGRFVKAFAVGSPEYQLMEGSKGAQKVDTSSRDFFNDAFALAFCFTGIQATLVMMGFLQERIITLGYMRTDGSGEEDKFGDAQFLVFCNRIVALVLCSTVLCWHWGRQPPHVPPLYVHSYTSFSNTISSWCQYEALKYVSFPTQTICKASKVVATMIMGTIVRGQQYKAAEYACGAGIAIGASMFLLASNGGDKVEEESSGHEGIMQHATTISGMVLMIGYLVFDAFTLNWQKALFDTRPRVSKYQMMLGVNAFSAILCAVSLAEQGSFTTSLGFMWTHANFSRDVFLLSVSGATGQLFIYQTIERFGPIVFAVIMTMRQMFSILLSAFHYGHAMSLWALIGFATVFGSMFLDIYRRYFENNQSRQPSPKQSDQQK